MMKTHSVLNFVVFNLCLVVGYTFSLRFYQPGESLLSGLLKVGSSESQPSIASMENGQRSILLVGTNAIDTLNPALESVWLVTYLPTGSTIQLLPVFPSGKQLTNDFEKQLAQSFRLNKMGGNFELDGGFLRLLEKNNFWWSGYIVFDRVSLTKALSLVGDLEMNGKMYSGAQVIQDFPDVQVDGRDAYSFQAAIFQSMCHKLTATGTYPKLINLGTPRSNHIATNLDASQLQEDIDRAFSGDHRSTCKFPTLDISMIEP